MAKTSNDCGGRYQHGSRHPTVQKPDHLGGAKQQTNGTMPPDKGGKSIKNK